MPIMIMCSQGPAHTRTCTRTMHKHIHMNTHKHAKTQTHTTMQAYTQNEAQYKQAPTHKQTGREVVSVPR